MVARKWLYFVILISLLSFLLTGIFYYYQSKLVERESYYAKVEVGDIYGIDVNGSAFVFGTIIPGGEAKRQLQINNTDDSPVVVRVIPSGDVARFLDYQEVRVGANSLETIGMNASVPQGMDNGVYEGKVDVLIIKNAK